MELQLVQQIAEIDRQAWNGLVMDNNPFLRHEFLQALEDHQAVSPEYGWYPQHLVLYDKARLVAAMPLYAKTNSYGEFVFDHSWAQAWQSVGLAYFPKWVTSIPYAPVTGQRFLIAADQNADHIRQIIIGQLQTLAYQHNISGWHVLFANANDQAWLSQQTDWLVRHDCHFHWHNRGYKTFDDFLDELKQKKRKNIKQERRKVQDAGIVLKRLNGHTAGLQDWQDFSLFYAKTFVEKYSVATLNQGFFQAVAQALPDHVLLVMAQREGKNIAGSLMFHSDTTLFGRHWGCIEEVNSLHFEACYYQGIEFAIEKGLQTFEPGAGGEHKLARGFEPVGSESAHWLRDNPFKQGIDGFLAEEKRMIEHYIKDCVEHSPYR